MLCWFWAMKMARLPSFARLPYTGPMNWFKEASNFDLENLSNIQLRLFFFFSFSIPMFSPKANINIYIISTT